MKPRTTQDAIDLVRSRATPKKRAELDKALADERGPVGVGSPVWVFDENRRVYSTDAQGWNKLVWRAHWVRRRIWGENSRSWLVGPDGSFKPKRLASIPKRGPFKSTGPWRLVAYSEAEIDQHEWVHDHADEIGQKVGGLTDFATLRMVANAIGYAPKKTT